MLKYQQISDFFSEKRVAVIGAPRNPKKFGGQICKELKDRGFDLFPVNPATDELYGDKCYRSIKDLPRDIKRALVVTPSSASATVLKELLDSQVEHIWIQQASDSPEALQLAQESKKNIIFKECIMMFAEPVKSIHSFHRFFVKLFGAYPK